jgi:hypothetical protein
VRDDTVTEALVGEFAPQDIHIDDAVMQKAVRGLLGTQFVESESIGRLGPLNIHSIASSSTREIVLF